MTVEDQPMNDAWSAGSYSVFAKQYLPLAGQVVGASAIDAGDDVLDVGCGTGSVALAAAHHGAVVTGVDISPELLDTAAENAAIAGVESAHWQQGDAADLPFDADTFDATLSSLGHIYGDPPDRVADELLRVTRPGGTIGFTCWTPSSFFPMAAGYLLHHVPPAVQPDISEPPFMWGDPDVVTRRFGGAVDGLSVTTDAVTFPAMSPDHFWEDLATYSGLFRSYLNHVEDVPALRSDIVDVIEDHFDPVAGGVELTYRVVTTTVSEGD